MGGVYYLCIAMRSEKQLDILRFNIWSLTEEELEWCLEKYDYSVSWIGSDGKEHWSLVYEKEMQPHGDETEEEAIERAWRQKRWHWDFKILPDTWRPPNPGGYYDEDVEDAFEGDADLYNEWNS